MAEFGLNLVPRGAGFVVAADGRRAAVKASDVSPDWAFKALTADHDSEGVILKKGAEYLVKPVTPAQAARAGVHFQRGDLISLDPRGRFVRAPDRGLSRGGEMDQGLKP